jgi:glycosyltransferase involved in cell wall biosynthesis
MRFGAMLLTDILHDRSTARWLKRVHGQDKHLVLHAFQDSGTRSLAVTRAIGGVGILEVILPPAETSSYIDAEDSDAKENFVKNNDLRWIRLQKDIVNADIVLSQSVYTERYLKNNSNTGVRICQMPLGVDPVRFPFLQRRRGKTFTLGCVGQICFRKGADILSNIAKWISERDDTVLLIAGEVTDAAGKILVSGLPRHCQYFGKIADEDLAAFYQRCDAILIVSRAEGACNVIYEAMASGTPCIVSPAAQSIVKDRDNGVIVEGYKTENWLNALQAVMNDSSSLVSMSHNCSEVANEYSWDRYHIRLSELYKTLSPIV